MTPCRSAAESLLAYRAGALDADDHEAVRSHLASCSRCQELEAQVGELPAVLRESIAPPPELWSQIMKSHEASTSEDKKAVTPAVIPDPSIPVKVRQDCVYCRGSLFAARVHCADCLARYHESCFIANKGCGVLGCEGREFLKPQGLEEVSRRFTPGLHAPLGRARKPLLALAALGTVVGASFLVAQKYVASLPEAEVAEAPKELGFPEPPRVIIPKAASQPVKPVKPVKPVEPVKPRVLVIPEGAAKTEARAVGVRLERRQGDHWKPASHRFGFPRSAEDVPDLVYDTCGYLHLNGNDSEIWRVRDIGAADPLMVSRNPGAFFETAREAPGPVLAYRAFEPRAGRAYILEGNGAGAAFVVCEVREGHTQILWLPGRFFEAPRFEYPPSEEEWYSWTLDPCKRGHGEE